jgi:hypothetical protein
MRLVFVLLIGLLTSVAANAQCGNLVMNPSTHKLDCIGTAGGKNLPNGYLGLDANGNADIGTTVLTTAQTLDVVCSGNITTAFTAALALWQAGSISTIRLSSGSCYITTIATLYNTGGSAPTQPPLRITGQGASMNGYWTTLPTGGTMLDLQQNATVAKIDTRGAGYLEIDHLTLMDSQTDCAPFIQSTNTTLRVHDVTFSGTATGAAACNDGIRLGGGTSATVGSAATSPFQGYGTVIASNFFDKIQQGVYGQNFANSVIIANNTWSPTCGGGSTVGAVHFDGTGGFASDNTPSGNLVEVTNYVYGFLFGNNSYGNGGIGNQFWDHTGTTLSDIHLYGSQSTTGNGCLYCLIGIIDSTIISSFAPVVNQSGAWLVPLSPSMTNSSTSAFAGASAMKVFNSSNTNNNWAQIEFDTATNTIVAGIAAQITSQGSATGNVSTYTREADGFKQRVLVTDSLSLPNPITVSQSGTSGTAACSESMQGVLKIATCLLTGYANTGTAQTYAFPTAFSTTPLLQESLLSCGAFNPSATATTLTLPANAAMTAETCNVIVMGQ